MESKRISIIGAGTVALAAPAALAVPDGWQAMPVKPTPVMLDVLRDRTELPELRYALLLAASPHPPAPADKKDGE